MQRSVKRDRKHISIVGAARVPGTARPRRPDDENDTVAALLRAADATQLRIARAAAALGPAASLDRVAAMLGALEAADNGRSARTELRGSVPRATTPADPPADVAEGPAAGVRASVGGPEGSAAAARASVDGPATGARSSVDGAEGPAAAVREWSVDGSEGTAAAVREPADPSRGLAEIVRGLAELEATGLFEGPRCTDPAVAARILGELPGLERRMLHRKAAEVLHDGGFAPAVVAPHLVAAGDARAPWAADVLAAAADEAVSQDQMVWAGKYFELAYRSSDRARDRAVIATRLVAVDWRANPSSRTRNFGRLRAAVGAGLVPRAEVPGAVLQLLWHGCVQHADRALTVLDRGVNSLAVDARIDFLCAWLRYTHPTHVERHQALFAGHGPADYESGERDSPHRQAAELLAAMATQRPPAEIASAAQRLLSAHRPTLTTVEPLVAAVDCLIHTDRLDLADAWCTSLLAEAAARHAPTWRSMFAAVRAETLLRKGNLAEAAENAVLALNLVPAEHLGVWVGRPLGVLVRALTAQGKHAEAAAQLRRQVPRAMFESRFALGYLTAYGEHCLATGRPDEALRYFRQCGNLSRQWGMDFAWLTPWRNHMASAYLSAGRTREARAFASMHLDLIGGAEGHRSGGVSLRVLAATSDPHRRVSLLRRAVAVARAGDGDLELAGALSDLGRAYRVIGDTDRARPLLRDAARLAERCGAEMLSRRLRGDRLPPDIPPIARVRPAPTAFETLSPAERRVAELAALGKRNRDIADALAITTSTVEQHLTKVYRKLSVARRGELRFVLAAYVESTRSAVG